MEFIPADTLEDKILWLGKLSMREAKQIMLQLCQAAGHLQKLGIIHRDLKPLKRKLWKICLGLFYGVIGFVILEIGFSMMI